MNPYLTTSIGRLRLIALLEGISLLLLVFVAVPLKYLGDNPLLVDTIGPVHGGLFILYVILALWVAYTDKWKLFHKTWIVMLASFIPFGTFIVDRKYFKADFERVVGE